MQVFIGGRNDAEGQDSRIARVEHTALLVDKGYSRRSVTFNWASLANGVPADDDDGTVVSVGRPTDTEVRYNVATFFIDYTGSDKLELWPMSSPVETTPGAGEWYNMTGGDLSSGVDTRKKLNLLFDDGTGLYTAICRLCDGWFKLQACENGAAGGVASVLVMFGIE